VNKISSQARATRARITFLSYDVSSLREEGRLLLRWSPALTCRYDCLPSTCMSLEGACDPWRHITNTKADVMTFLNLPQVLPCDLLSIFVLNNAVHLPILLQHLHIRKGLYFYPGTHRLLYTQSLTRCPISRHGMVNTMQLFSGD
jgi:hypothetical protein